MPARMRAARLSRRHDTLHDHRSGFIVNVRFTHLVKQPYPLYLEFSMSFPVIIGISLFIPLFLFTFQPFDLNETAIENRRWFLIGLGIITGLVLSFNAYVLPRFFSWFFTEDRWTVGREILWLLWNVLTCVSVAAIYQFIQPTCPFTLTQLAGFYAKGFLVAILPVSLLVVLSYMTLLHARLRKADAVTKSIKAIPRSDILARTR